MKITRSLAFALAVYGLATPMLAAHAGSAPERNSDLLVLVGTTKLKPLPNQCKWKNICIASKNAAGDLWDNGCTKWRRELVCP